MKTFCLAFVLLVLSSFLAPGALRAQDTIVTTFSAVHQGDGSGLATRIVEDTFLFPHNLSGYYQINMFVILTCPTGGCDPFSRFASMQVFHNSEWYEIGRYMTPYGVACSWTLDVNDYRSLLTDTVILRSFIDTHTNPGWLVSVVFDFMDGTPAYKDIKVDNLWLDYNVVYGDSAQPVNLPPVTKSIDTAATAVKIKIVNTGHGEGNTDNAAEFSQKTHSLWVNGIQAASQFLWRSDCGINACSPQNGPWQFNRAGWCAGSDVLPFYGDISSYVTTGQNATLEYRLQPYVNSCNPGNTNCISGITCADCNYNSSGHIEPNYKISGQLITYIGFPTGLEPFAKNQKQLLAPNPSSGIFSISPDAMPMINITVFNVMGKQVYSAASLGRGDILDLTFLPEGVYFFRAQTSTGLYTVKLLIR